MRKRESFGFDLPDFEPQGSPTAEDVLRSAMENVPQWVCPEEWRRAVRELAEKGAVLVENPDGTVTLRPREDAEREGLRWGASSSSTATPRR